MEQVSFFIYLPPKSDQHYPYNKLNIHTHQVSTLRLLVFSLRKHLAKCLKDVMNLQGVYFKSVFCSEGASR